MIQIGVLRLPLTLNHASEFGWRFVCPWPPSANCKINLFTAGLSKTAAKELSVRMYKAIFTWSIRGIYSQLGAVYLPPCYQKKARKLHSGDYIITSQRILGLPEKPIVTSPSHDLPDLGLRFWLEASGFFMGDFVSISRSPGEWMPGSK